jgi:hypothetical protein
MYNGVRVTAAAAVRVDGRTAPAETIGMEPRAQASPAAAASTATVSTFQEARVANPVARFSTARPSPWG